MNKIALDLFIEEVFSLKTSPSYPCWMYMGSFYFIHFLIFYFHFIY